ncbi:hypothetical protein IscW_ISCW009657 [Ixodes scapularis]|uniref:Uncharacterized protein n=1 Tax=Ixodes scapularis TaxID=6945 RepID=B7Q075_IXOSC|nr:hypothetical protein IscW_ISCW009657 [Ixodes scapularis]|eukprot:XP_002407040.1 hypothetical protein IscW_ISCW009657 [Ixodes scapularis]
MLATAADDVRIWNADTFELLHHFYLDSSARAATSLALFWLPMPLTFPQDVSWPAQPRPHLWSTSRAWLTEARTTPRPTLGAPVPAPGSAVAVVVCWRWAAVTALSCCGTSSRAGPQLPSR